MPVLVWFARVQIVFGHAANLRFAVVPEDGGAIIFCKGLLAFDKTEAVVHRCMSARLFVTVIKVQFEQGPLKERLHHF